MTRKEVKARAARLIEDLQQELLLVEIRKVLAEAVRKTDMMNHVATTPVAAEATAE